MLKVLNLTKKFPNGKTICVDFNAEFRLGDRYIWLGSSGIGKSTLAKILCGYEHADQGQVVLENQIIKSPNSNCIYVSQTDDLFGWKTVAEQINFLNQISQHKKISAADMAAFELNNCLHLYPLELSGGMKKRLQLIRTLIFKPAVLILDETLTAIDTNLRNRILDYLDSVWRSQNTLVICISHQTDSFLNGFFNKSLSFPLN